MGSRGGSRALRGLAEGRNLLEQPSAPPGIDLTRPSQPVDDLTAYIRYGSALTFSHLQDGWVTATFEELKVGAGFDSTNHTWDTQVSGDFGISQAALENMMLWIYHISVSAHPVTALVDIGVSRITMAIERGVGNVANGTTQGLIWLNDATGIELSALGRNLTPQAAPRFPYPWPPGAVMQTKTQNINANDIVWKFNLLCRIVPFGVPPLP